MSSDRKQKFAWAALAAAGFVAGLTPQTQAQDQLWIRQFGMSLDDQALALVPDGAGGVMLAGYTYCCLAGQNPPGEVDAILARYDRAGNQLWIREFGTYIIDVATALAPDRAGGVIVAGLTWGSLGGPNAGLADVFLARYDGAGNQLWIRQFGARSFEIANALAPDGAGGAIVAGYTEGSLGGPSAGSDDVFLARYDGAGNQLWLLQFGTNGFDRATALATDGVGGVIVAGWTAGSPGGFLVRYDGAGNLLWTRQLGTIVPFALAPDGASGVMVAGGISGDAFLAHYDSAGNRLWISQFGTSSVEQANAVALDGAGGVMVAGFTEGSLGGPHAGGKDAFLARFDSAGDRLWISQLGTSARDSARALAPDGVGGVLVAGLTKGSLGGPNAGGYDAFLARFTGAFPLGDLNCDGRFDGGDIDPFFLALGDPMAYAEQFPTCDPLLGDLSRDGRLDGGDIDPFFACLGGNCP